MQFDLPPTAIKDWDLVNKEVLQDNIVSFITANKIEPSQITFVLSEQACFSQDVVAKDQAKTNVEAHLFLDAVPFNYVISKVYKIAQGVRVVAANKDIIDAITEVLSEKGFILFAVVPAAIFPQEGAKTILDAQFAKVIESNRELIMTGNMIESKTTLGQSPAPTPAGPIVTTKKASSGYLPYLIGVGALAVIVLIFLLLFRR